MIRFDFKGKVGVVTGAARGLGLAITQGDRPLVWLRGSG